MNYTVMVIDDEWPALEQMRELLQRCEGIGPIHVYDNSREAFTAAADLKPDIIFLDIQMPELSGLAFAEKLLAFSPATDIVFVTAYRNYAVEAFELSAVDYLLKPVDPSRLLKTWNKFVSRRPSSSAEQHSGATSLFQSLGGYELTGPRGLVKWSTHKAGELFAYLWFQRQASVNIILNELFPQSNYEKGKQYLHTTVYQIRKTLKTAALDDVIELTFDGENYRLETKGITSDSELFGDAASAAFQESDTDKLRDAAGMYTGDLLQSIDSLWIYPIRNKYRALHIKVLEQLTARLQEAGRPYEAEEYAARLAELEPLEEAYALRLISIYYDMGKPFNAQRRFTQFRDSYKAELGDELPDRFIEAYQRLGK